MRPKLKLPFITFNLKKELIFAERVRRCRSKGRTVHSELSEFEGETLRGEKDETVRHLLCLKWRPRDDSQSHCKSLLANGASSALHNRVLQWEILITASVGSQKQNPIKEQIYNHTVVFKIVFKARVSALFLRPVTLCANYGCKLCKGGFRCS